MIAPSRRSTSPREREPRIRALFADHGEGGPGRPPPDAQGEMAGVPAHHRHEEPLVGRGRGLHQELDEVRALVHGGGEAEGGHVRRQRPVVVGRIPRREA